MKIVTHASLRSAVVSWWGAMFSKSAIRGLDFGREEKVVDFFSLKASSNYERAPELCVLIASRNSQLFTRCGN